MVFESIADGLLDESENTDLGAFLVFNHLNRLLDLMWLCLDRLFRRLRFRRLNWIEPLVNVMLILPAILKQIYRLLDLAQLCLDRLFRACF